MFRSTKRSVVWPYLLCIASSGFFVNAAFLGWHNSPLALPVIALAVVLLWSAGKAFSRLRGLGPN